MRSDTHPLVASFKTLLAHVGSVPSDRAASVLGGLSGRGAFVPRLTHWLTANSAAFPEPITVVELDSVHDPGLDVLVTGTRSHRRVGFQVKSDRDLREGDFTRHLKAQILDAKHTGVDLIVLVFASAPTTHPTRVKYWQNLSLDSAAPEILCLPPLRSAALYLLFDSAIEPIEVSGRSWADFFVAVGRPALASFYLDTWPDLTPDRRFLAPASFQALRRVVGDHRLTFLVGPPATGKTFTVLQLLWEAFQKCRPVRWLTVNDLEPTEGPIPNVRSGLVEMASFERRVDALLRTIGPEPGRPPEDEHDTVSCLLVRDALVYLEDPFGKTDDEYAKSLSTYRPFDLERLVDALDRSAARTGCQLLVTTRETLFDRWREDLARSGRSAPAFALRRLVSDQYSFRDLFDFGLLLARSRGLAASPESIAEALADEVESPFEVETLIRQLPPQATTEDVGRLAAQWKGESRDKVASLIRPRHDADVLVLLLVAVPASGREGPASPLGVYSELHRQLALEGQPESTFEDSLARLAPVLASSDDPEELGLPSHSVVTEAIRGLLGDSAHRPLLRQIVRALPDVVPMATPPRSGRVNLGGIFVTRAASWVSYRALALYLVSLGLALEGSEEAERLEYCLFERIGFRVSEYWRLLQLWPHLPIRIRARLLAGLEHAVQGDPRGLREVAGFLPQFPIEASVAWRVLSLLLAEPRRGASVSSYEPFPWSFLFLHLEMVPPDIKKALDRWADEEPASFVSAMHMGLLLQWDRLPASWRAAFDRAACNAGPRIWHDLVPTIGRFWSRAPQPFKDLFDTAAIADASWARSIVGSQALFYADEHPDLERYALAASRDADAGVRLETFRWGRGDDVHRRIAEVLLDGATPGLAAEMLLDLLEETVREEIAPWEREVIARCEAMGGDAAAAAIALAHFEGAKRVGELGYEVAASPFDQPEIVRAGWLWAHLNGLRQRPTLTNDDLDRLLRGLKEPRIRGWCLFYVSYQLTALPQRFEQLLAELSQSSADDAEAIEQGAQQRQPVDERTLLRFPITRMVA